MKNYYLLRLIKTIMLFMLFLTGIGSFAQEVSKNPLLESQRSMNDEIISAANYTVTKVSLSKTASDITKAEFAKTHGADFYYVYTNSKGKIVSKDESDEAFRKQIEEADKSKLLTNLKK